jgi:cytochrome P450
LYASANRDEAMFEEPDAFRPDRANVDKHVAFGVGPHFCLGAHLARAEALVFVTELAERFDRLESGSRDERDDRGSFMMRGRRRLMIRAVPRQAETSR